MQFHFCKLQKLTHRELELEFLILIFHSKYGLEYSIARPFNAVGIGEVKAKTKKDLTESSKKLALSHVVPDLILKTLNYNGKLEILGKGNQIRHYTYGEDLAKGIVLLLDHEKAKNNDFNLSTSKSTTVLELADLIFKKIHPNEIPNYEFVDAFKYDVQKRIPSTEKAKSLLGYDATTSLSEMLDIVIPWIKEAKDKDYF